MAHARQTRFEAKEYKMEYNIEERSKEKDKGEMAALDYEMKQERLRREENLDEENLDLMVKTGSMTGDEAQKIIARKRMHDKGADIFQGAELEGVVAAAADFQTTEQMLEELLDYESKNPIIRSIETALGISTIRRAKKREQTRRADRRFKHPFPLVNNLVHATGFEMCIGAVMLVNGLTIGIQTSRSNEDIDEAQMSGTMDSITLAENIMTGIFVLEIFLRVTADGWLWFFKTSNVLDTGLIFITGVLPLWFFPLFNVEIDEMRTLQVLRVVRLTRLVRMVRTVKVFRIFWKLIQGVLDSGRTLLWLYIMMGSVLYTISIFSVYWLARDPDLGDDEVTQVHFGNVPKSMITLFQVVTLDSWTSIARPMMDKSPRNMAVIAVFLLTIMVCSMVLLNLIMAIIVNTAFDRSKEDVNLMARKKEEEVASEIEELSRLFHEIDTDGSGYVSIEEYTDAVQLNENIKMKFAVLDIGEGDAFEIWELMDTGVGMNAGEVSIEQFTHTLRLLQGEAKAKDSFTIVKRVGQVNLMIQKLHAHLEVCREEADKIREECVAAHRALGGALQEMSEFVYYAGLCVPNKPAPRALKSLEADSKNRQIVVEDVEHMAQVRSGGRTTERTLNRF